MIEEHQPTPRMSEPGFTVQEWLAHRLTPTLNNKPVRYAKWWILKQLGRVSEQLQFLDFDGGHRLYVTVRNERYRVLGVSRSGVLSLQPVDNPQAATVYLPMTTDTDFSEWSNTAEGPLNESKFVPYV